MTEHRRYEHNPKRGETRSPMTEGTQRGPHAPDERDPHDPLTTPESATPALVGRMPDKQATGKKPAARDERNARSAMPTERD
jgi:hypothetical protein